MLLGFDIGGTKCAVITAEAFGDSFSIVGRAALCTDLTVSPEEQLQSLVKLADGLLKGQCPTSVGISCGGPLDSRRGLILSPPNLPGWDHVEICRILREHYGVPVHLQNDANACAVAEWKFGAGRGTRNMIFLTFGTGLGAGLILDGHLYSGTNDNAGEVGHIRLAAEGPVGYGKAGSFEGFCSGGGIAKLGYRMALEAMEMGCVPAYFRPAEDPSHVTARSVAEAAQAGDPTALAVYRRSGERLGEGLAILVDLLNPECIVIGSVFAKARDLLWPHAERILAREALPGALAGCRVLPAALGDGIGDYAAIGVALLEE